VHVVADSPQGPWRVDDHARIERTPESAACPISQDLSNDGGGGTGGSENGGAGGGLGTCTRDSDCTANEYGRCQSAPPVNYPTSMSVSMAVA
jgi:hypothetical protein